MAARRHTDERLDVVLKYSLQDEAAINRKTAKSINEADSNSAPHRLRIERVFYIPISGNTVVEIQHFDTVSDRERHRINLKVSWLYAQKHSFVIVSCRIESCEINVGYLLVRFEYFRDRFAQKVDQNRARRALSDGLFTFRWRPSHHRENPKILQKKTEKMFCLRKNLADSPKRWARVDQVWI